MSGAVESARKLGSGLVIDADADGPGLREWLDGLGQAAGPAAAFDTRLGGLTAFTGRASKTIARHLARHGFTMVAPPESFLVTNANQLLPGEADRTAPGDSVLSSALVGRATCACRLGATDWRRGPGWRRAARGYPRRAAAAGGPEGTCRHSGQRMAAAGSSARGAGGWPLPSDRILPVAQLPICTRVVSDYRAGARRLETAELALIGCQPLDGVFAVIAVITVSIARRTRRTQP